MRVDKDTKISSILRENMEAVEAIARINRHLTKLRNPFLRKMLAPRITIAAAAQVGNTTVNKLLKALEEIGFEVEYENQEQNKNKKENKITMKKTTIVDLDVRPILEGGTDPFNVIMEALKTLKPGETLKVINTFEPIPLLNILKSRGYDYESERPEEGIVYTYLNKSAEKSTEKAESSITDMEDLSYDDVEKKFKGKFIELDVRDLEMPMPMVTILEAVESLDHEHALYVHHKKLPQYLLPELKQREFDYKSKDVDEDNIKLIIYRK